VLFLSNLLLLLGCASPALTGNAIYQVDVRHLIANLEAGASEGANQNVTLGGNTLLPTHWRIGLGGKRPFFVRLSFKGHIPRYHQHGDGKAQY
jgi:hypothetical protein